MTEHYAPREALPVTERNEYQAAWLRPLVQHAYQNAPAARRLMDGVGISPGDILHLDDLQRIPITRKDELIELQREAPPFGGWLAVPPAVLRRVFLSPGPLLDPQGQEADYWRFAPAMFAAGMRAGDRVLCAVSYHLTPLGHIFDEALAALGCVVLPGGVGSTELQVSLVRASDASGYVGTPSFLNILLEKAAELGGPLSLRRAFVAAEMLPESLRAAIENRGVTVCQGYGTADLGCLAYECEQRRGMHVPESAIIEIVDPATGRPVPPGEPGEVIATVDRRTYPLLRFGTGDLSVLDTGACPCGRTSPRLVRILGRIGDAVKVRGMFVHPRQVEDVVGRFAQVRRHQLVVTRSEHRDGLIIRLETDPVDAAFIRRFESVAREVLKVRLTVELVSPGTIPTDAKAIDDQRAWD